MSSNSAAQKLFGLKVAELIWFLITTLFWSLLWRAGLDFHLVELVLRASSVVWIIFVLLELVFVYSFSIGRRGTPAESLARAAFYFAIITLCVDLFSMLPMMMSSMGGGSQGI